MLLKWIVIVVVRLVTWAAFLFFCFILQHIGKLSTQSSVKDSYIYGWYFILLLRECFIFTSSWCFFSSSLLEMVNYHFKFGNGRVWDFQSIKWHYYWHCHSLNIILDIYNCASSRSQSLLWTTAVNNAVEVCSCQNARAPLLAIYWFQPIVHVHFEWLISKWSGIHTQYIDVIRKNKSISQEKNSALLMAEQQLSSVADQHDDHVGNSDGVRFTITTHFASRKITMARSCSDLEPHAEGHCLHMSLSRGSTNSTREIQLTGQCRACGRDYKCTCCRNCNHLVVIYAPVSRCLISLCEAI